MLQVKTIKRDENSLWKQFTSGHYISLEEYERKVNDFCKTVKVVSIGTVTWNGKILHMVVYDDGVELK